jgi:hypothetical protein
MIVLVAVVIDFRQNSLNTQDDNVLTSGSLESASSQSWPCFDSMSAEHASLALPVLRLLCVFLSLTLDFSSQFLIPNAVESQQQHANHLCW